MRLKHKTKALDLDTHSIEFTYHNINTNSSVAKADQYERRAEPIKT